MPRSDIIRYADGSKGRYIAAECHIETKNMSMAQIEMDEAFLDKLFPDWPERVCEFISLRIGPCTDPGKLWHIEIRDIIKSCLLWVLERRGTAIVGNEDRTLWSIWPDWANRSCKFISLKLGPSQEPNGRHSITAREMIKNCLLWVVSEDAKISPTTMVQ